MGKETQKRCGHNVENGGHLLREKKTKHESIDSVTAN